MRTALWLLAVQAALGAFDTLWFHEWRARLPALSPAARPELRLHAARSGIYTIVFGTLPWIAWTGAWAAALLALLLAEIVITLADFVVEGRIRAPLGGVYSGERVTHGVMGVVYGAFLAHFLPVAWDWLGRSTSLVLEPVDAPAPLRAFLALAAAGVLASAIRDAAAAAWPSACWPWRRPQASPT